MNGKPTDLAEAATPTQAVGQYWKVLRRRWLLVVGIIVVVTCAAVAFSLTSTKKYDATAKVLLQRSQPTSAIINQNAVPRSSNDPERDVNTDVELIKLRVVADQVRRKLRLRLSSQALLDKIHTDTEANSNVASVTARDESPRQAARIANAFVDNYVTFRQRSARASIDEAVKLAQRQLAALSPLDRDSAQGRQVQDRLRELQIDAALQTGGVEVVQRATRPTSPSRPRPVLSTALGLGLGGILAVAAALLLELADRRIKDEEMIEEVFGLPILAAIPRLASRAVKNPLDGTHGEYESYGLLAANLRLSRQGSGTLMVTSAGPEEGKTTVALGLARAVATLGLRVIVIEADLRRPQMAKYAGLRGTPGISEVLSGKSKFEDALVWLDIGAHRPRRSQDDDLLGVLCAGTPAATPQRMLGSRGMGKLIAEAAKRAQIVIIDTAPLGAVNDAVTILNHVGAVLVVARMNRTTKDGARRTMRTLGNLSVPVPGVVVTDVSGPRGLYDGYPTAEDSTTVERELRA